MKLQNWLITDNDNGYTAPEAIRKIAIGDVYGHPTRPDGHHIRTSYLVEINLQKRYIKTASGSIYKLGRMHPDYAKFMRELKKG